jgi:hypothetical protein
MGEPIGLCQPEDEHAGHGHNPFWAMDEEFEHELALCCCCFASRRAELKQENYTVAADGRAPPSE